MNLILRWLALGSAVCAVGAQVNDQVRRATITASRGTSGACTIEVRVDGTAEIDVLGDSARLRTTSGQIANWTRMDCTDPMPYGMADFRLRKVSGRGNVQLLQDPRGNNSTAVVRIDDPRGGADGYVLEIEWSGASGGYALDGFSTAGRGLQRGGAVGGIGGRAGARAISYERALDLCRAAVHDAGQRNYGLRNIDITAVGVDTSQGRRNWVTGTFSEASYGNMRGGSGYRFNCSIDYAVGQVNSVEFLRADGSLLQPGGGQATGRFDQAQILRACQDAVVARVNQDGYQNVQFNTAGIDNSRSGWVAGTLAASRGILVRDNFEFGCAMDFNSGRVLNVQVNRR